MDQLPINHQDQMNHQNQVSIHDQDHLDSEAHDLESKDLSPNSVSVDSQSQDDEPPAIRVALTGHYLIEASAGTGKTWTLTGIVLRLLIESKRAPEQIIATTFTRAAAAEMRQRIHERLVDFYHVLQWINQLSAYPDNHSQLYPQHFVQGVRSRKETQAPNQAVTQALTQAMTQAQRQTRFEWLKAQALLAGNAELISDPINAHLIGYLLDHTEDYPLADAIRRCKLVLTTLDKLFVGTLDSLSQKWLAEYSAETGYQQGVQISADEQLVIESIIHDAVRGFQSHLYYQQPEIYQLLQHTKRLTAPSDHLNVAQKSMQFISTPIDEVALGDDIDFVAYQQALADFVNCDLSDIAPYFDTDYGLQQGLKKNGKLSKNVAAIVSIQQLVKQYHFVFYSNLDKSATVLFEMISDVFISEEDGGTVFKKGFEGQRQQLVGCQSILLLKNLYDFVQQIEHHLDALIETLNRDIALKVRQKLPSVLEEQRETTFALQMVRLNQALTGKQGERLARYIRHHYPVALIDESQDINGEQASMIERIYLSKSISANSAFNDTDNKARQFLLLVGDPKQAIYGFRGGDVANYNAMKARFDSKRIMSLNVNRRSNERLINALNHWFGRAKSSTPSTLPLNLASEPISTVGERVADRLAQLGKGIYYQHITAANLEAQLSWQRMIAEQSTSAAKLSPECQSVLPNHPVSVIHLPYDKQAKHDAFELTALHIAALLASNQTYKGRAIKPSDIGVLGRRKHELKQVEDMLSKLGVPTLETAEQNVFNTPIAIDLAALLEAMLRPHRRDVINRVLTSHFYQLSLDEVQDLIASMEPERDLAFDNTHQKDNTQEQRYQDFQNYLKAAAGQWQNNGILSALHFLFSRNPLANNKQQNSLSNIKDNIEEKTKSNKSIWVTLANLENGARYLMDLRQLMDILAQHGMTIGEHELLAWYKKNMNSKRIPEWAQQQPLPTESGVQLMTIHKSKGLEFPIVYVIGMDGASPKAGSRSKHNLFLYDYEVAANNANNAKTNTQTVRHLSASITKRAVKSAKGDAPEDYYAQFETTENYEELRRLGYVAFTRASEQLYIVLADTYNKKDAERKPSLQWLASKDNDNKSFVLPTHLQAHVGWLDYNILERDTQVILAASHSSQQKAKADDTTATTFNLNPNQSLRIDYTAAHAQIQRSYFKGWAKTSFTALSRQLSEQGKALAVFDDSVEDDLDFSDSMQLLSYKNENTRDSIDTSISRDDIRFRFVKGANAGTFLHEIFEKIEFTSPQYWSAIIDQGIRQYQLPMTYSSAETQQRLLTNKASTESSEIEATEANALIADHEQLMDWIADVLATPLSASGVPLAAIPKAQRMPELGFNMGLAPDFLPEDINTVFAEYLADDSDKHINLSNQYSDHIYRYLRGEIDLVYEYAGKYYVVDYKSNYLGASLGDYNNESLSLAMNKAGYWLQAAIYQVALHRFLRLRLEDYEGNETQYLGAVEYVFLRGIGKQKQDQEKNQNQGGNTQINGYGLIKWDIPFAVVKALDEMFGMPSR